MIEYFGLCSAVEATASALAAARTDPALAGMAAKLGAALKSDPDTARLGACIGPLLAQVQSGDELDLLPTLIRLFELRGISRRDLELAA